MYVQATYVHIFTNDINVCHVKKQVVNSKILVVTHRILRVMLIVAVCITMNFSLQVVSEQTFDQSQQQPFPSEVSTNVDTSYPLTVPTVW